MPIRDPEPRATSVAVDEVFLPRQKTPQFKPANRARIVGIVDVRACAPRAPTPINKRSLRQGLPDLRTRTAPISITM
jgi:hypothetical protein